MSGHFLHKFLRPNNIAIYGANNKIDTMGTMLLVRLITNGYHGKIFPIHLRLDNVLGYMAYKSISDLPEIPDLVIIVFAIRGPKNPHQAVEALNDRWCDVLAVIIRYSHPI